MRILVSGMIAGDPHQGGASWAVLQYLLGLKRLGHEVTFVEPIRKLETFASDTVRVYFQRVMHGLDFNCALLLENTRESYNLPYPELIADYDLLLNISGMLKDAALTDRIPIRVYLDLDPAFIQCWHTQGIDMNFDAHTHYVTVGSAIGSPACPVPTCDRDWIPTLPPVVLAEWPVADHLEHDAFTTIANWRGYGSVTLDGVLYGQKAHSLRQFMDLPTRTAQRLAPAIAISPAETPDLEALHANRWEVLDPAAVADDPDSYRRFVQGSYAELGIAKSGYVASRCGWFSDRSAAYLASGRPVLAQNTGFKLPCGEGLLKFDTLDDILAGIDAINSDYPGHCRAARELAVEQFDSDRVLSRLLGTVLA